MSRNDTKLALPPILLLACLFYRCKVPLGSVDTDTDTNTHTNIHTTTDNDTDTHTDTDTDNNTENNTENNAHTNTNTTADTDTYNNTDTNTHTVVKVLCIMLPARVAAPGHFRTLIGLQAKIKKDNFCERAT